MPLDASMHQVAFFIVYKLFNLSKFCYFVYKINKLLKNNIIKKIIKLINNKIKNMYLKLINRLNKQKIIHNPNIYYRDEAGLCGKADPDNRRTYP